MYFRQPQLVFLGRKTTKTAVVMPPVGDDVWSSSADRPAVRAMYGAVTAVPVQAHSHRQLNVLLVPRATRKKYEYQPMSSDEYQELRIMSRPK